MEGIKNFLQLINDNWTTITTILILLFAIYTKAKKFYLDWKAKTEEEKQKAIEEAKQIAIINAKNALADFILVLVSKAELEWQSEEGKLGKVKRAQVIAEIYAKYPILEEVEDKDALLEYIDTLIAEALKTVRKEIRPALNAEVENNGSNN